MGIRGLAEEIHRWGFNHLNDITLVLLHQHLLVQSEHIGGIGMHLLPRLERIGIGARLIGRESVNEFRNIRGAG